MTTFAVITEEDIKAAIRKDKGTKSVGVDEIPMSVLKKVIPEVTAEVAAMANASVREQKWPAQWKRAEIVPIWKRKATGKSHYPTDQWQCYRPSRDWWKGR